jgi:GT2 family glycosyltransferase
MIDMVVATRMSGEEFWNSTATGKSLQRQSYSGKLTYRVWENNVRGLSEVYNDSISAANEESTMIFIHDDVWIDDSFFYERVLRGLEFFDVIGVAGSRVRRENQLSWGYHMGENGPEWRSEYTSGRVAHGKNYCGAITDWGLVPSEVVILDGVMLATRKKSLVRANVKFDPQFKFHFYDMDFCRSAVDSGLRLATWPISLTHESQGSFFTQNWQEMYQRYKDKWGS